MTEATSLKIRKFVFPLIISTIWLSVSLYTFDKKADINGDNFFYYLTASALADGNGYSEPWTAECSPTSAYPPGYPILMTPLMVITDSIVAQKWMNELFVLASLLLLYFALMRIGVAPAAAFTATSSATILPRLFHFSTMMMAEPSSLLTSALVFYFLVKLQEKDGPELKSKWFYLMLLMLVLNYHVRTQGIALLCGVCLYFLLRKRWMALVSTMGGFALGCLPWILRNKFLNLGGNRYLNMVMLSNPWRPEEGTVSIGEFAARFFDTLKMLVFNAVPSCIIPFVKVDADNPTYTFWAYLAGAVILALIVIGCIKIGKMGWMVGGYLIATFFVISCFSTPSGSRYITSILPFLAITEIIGLIWALNALVQLKWKKFTVPAIVLLPLLFTARPGLDEQHTMANMPYPENYRDFFEVSKMLRKAPEGSVVCCRKQTMSYFYSGKVTELYRITLDKKELIQGLIDDGVDYVILDALGYSSTSRYLFPAIMEYMQCFQVLVSKENTGTYLLFFDRALAKSMIE